MAQYMQLQDGRCRYNKKNKGATDTGFVDISSGDENDLKVACATVGPISVAIDASELSFQFYSSGKHGAIMMCIGVDHSIVLYSVDIG